MSDQAVRSEKIIVTENICKSYTYYKNSNEFIEDLSDITIENISMEDVIRKLYKADE